MKLLCDDIKQTYVWVDDCDESTILSPHFDYEEDAIQWYQTISTKINKKGE